MGGIGSGKPNKTFKAGNMTGTKRDGFINVRAHSKTMMQLNCLCFALELPIAHVMEQAVALLAEKHQEVIAPLVALKEKQAAEREKEKT